MIPISTRTLSTFETDEVMEYLINLGIVGLKRVLTNRAFTASAKVQKAMDEYEENNNPILGFFKECEDEDFQIEMNQRTRFTSGIRNIALQTAYSL